MSSCTLLGKACWGPQLASSEARNHLVENYNCSFSWQSKAKQSAKFIEAIISSRLRLYNHAFGLHTSWDSPLSVLMHFPSVLLISLLAVTPDAAEGQLACLKESLQKPAKFKPANWDQLEERTRFWGPWTSFRSVTEAAKLKPSTSWGKKMLWINVLSQLLIQLESGISTSKLGGDEGWWATLGRMRWLSLMEQMKVDASARELRARDRSFYFQSVCGSILLSSKLLLEMFYEVRFSIATEKTEVAMSFLKYGGHWLFPCAEFHCLSSFGTIADWFNPALSTRCWDASTWNSEIVTVLLGGAGCLFWDSEDVYFASLTWQ